MLVIADAEGPQGIGGIMGGADSEISESTTTIVLEAANFTRAQILRTSQALGLRSDGSNRWEKGVHPHLAPLASRAAARLIVRALRRTHDAAADRRLRRPAARARSCACAWTASRTSRRSRSRSRARSRSSTASASIRAPARARSTCACRRPRFLDVTREIDVIEEIARIYGLEHVPRCSRSAPAAA